MKNILTKIKISSFVVYSLVLSVLFPAITAAQNTGQRFQNPLSNNNNLFSLIYSVLSFITSIGAAIVVFMVIYSGFLFVSAQGDESKLTKAKSVFLWTIIGGVILLGAAALAEVVCNTATSLGATGLDCAIRGRI
jgi:hypothetical protein